MEGYVEIKNLTHMVRTFKVRYAKISRNFLELYSNILDKKPKDSLDLFDLDLVQIKTTSPCKLIIQSIQKKWHFCLLCHSRSERDAWESQLRVWISVKSLEDPISIPQLLESGLLACVEYCSFYAQDIEGLLRVPGNSTTVKEIYYGICRFGERFLTKPLNSLEGLALDAQTQHVSQKKFLKRNLSSDEADGWLNHLQSPRAKLERNSSPRLASRSNSSDSRVNFSHTVDCSSIPIYDTFDVGSCLKLGLKLLPETLLTNALFDEFMEAQGKEDYRKLIKRLPEINRKILKSIMELTLLLWQAEDTTNMDPGKVAVCLGPNLLKRSTEVGFCDFSLMFFEMCQHIEEIFVDVNIPKYYPKNFWDFLNELDQLNQTDNFIMKSSNALNLSIANLNRLALSSNTTVEENLNGGCEKSSPSRRFLELEDMNATI